MKGEDETECRNHGRRNGSRFSQGDITARPRVHSSVYKVRVPACSPNGSEQGFYVKHERRSLVQGSRLIPTS